MYPTNPCNYVWFCGMWIQRCINVAYISGTGHTVGLWLNLYWIHIQKWLRRDFKRLDSMWHPWTHSGFLEPVSATVGWKDAYHLDKSPVSCRADKDRQTSTTCGEFRVAHQTNLHVFGLWDEAWEPTQTEGQHENSAQKSLDQDWTKDLLPVRRQR